MSMDIPEETKQPAAKAQTSRQDTPNLARALVLIVIAASLGFLGGVWFVNANDSPHNDEDFEIFWQSWDILDEEFYYDLPEDQEMVRGALQGLLATTGDRYTFLVPPIPAEFDRQATAGEFGGIGAYVSQDANGQLIITTPFNDFPAEKAGLRPGDVILSVDGTDVRGWTLDDAVALIRGEVGTEVTLTVYRPSENREITVDITRARVELPTVYATMYGEVGYIRLFSFNSRATALIESEIATFLDQDVEALILDLRGNPGGLLDQAVSVSDLFLDEGLVLTQRSSAGDDIIYRSTNGQIAEDLPLVVVMDELSASASEVVAGALRDRDRAILIGQTSFGKGSVQHVYDLADGSQLRLTVAVWYTPDEVPIQGQGLEPDITVELPEEPEPGQDTFIETALDYFAEQGIAISGELSEPETIPESESE